MVFLPAPAARIDRDKPGLLLRHPMKLLPHAELLERALKLLSVRDYSEHELRARLEPREAAEGDVDQILTRLRDLGFLDESRFAARKAADAATRRLVGKRRVLQELEARELDPTTISQAVERAYEGADEDALALAHLEKHLAPMLREERLEDPRGLQRAYGRLRRAGFSHASSVGALRAHSRLAASLDDFEAADE
ncbi:MAG: RecX family transcriptional regulator [Bryobacterales bacterium]|nr:RecX family transcriptional regulator [Bryobacterales bacterium]